MITDAQGGLCKGMAPLVLTVRSAQYSVLEDSTESAGKNG